MVQIQPRNVAVRLRAIGYCLFHSFHTLSQKHSLLDNDLAGTIPNKIGQPTSLSEARRLARMLNFIGPV